MVFERFAHSIATCAISGVTRLAGHTFVLFGEAPKKAGEAPALPNQKKDREQSTQATQSFLRLALCSLPPCERECATLAKVIAAHGTRLPRHPKIKEITNSTRNIKNRSFAMPADAAAIPPNPKTAATSAMIRNITAQPNISSPPHRLDRICRLTRVPLHACSR